MTNAKHVLCLCVVFGATADAHAQLRSAAAERDSGRQGLFGARREAREERLEAAAKAALNARSAANSAARGVVPQPPGAARNAANPNPLAPPSPLNRAAANAQPPNARTEASRTEASRTEALRTEALRNGTLRTENSGASTRNSVGNLGGVSGSAIGRSNSRPSPSENLPANSRGPVGAVQPAAAMGAVAGRVATAGALPPNMITYRGPGVLIRLPREYGNEIHFLIDDIEPLMLKPGEEHRLSTKASYVVRFSRGETGQRSFGQAYYSITEGVYDFTLTSRGWELYRQPEDAVASSSVVAAPQQPVPEPDALRRQTFPEVAGDLRDAEVPPQTNGSLAETEELPRPKPADLPKSILE